mmetsp:Transcript_10854/g.21600  ORF Transcript_10854/g.21600 Transcript_10854/m.21600 type:complete len:258 (+) Transcript_10854:302-1075(+)
MYNPYAPDMTATSCGAFSGTKDGSNISRIATRPFVIPTPRRLAKKPTPNNLAPFRTTEPQRWTNVKGSYPGGTFWNALSGQPAKMLESIPGALDAMLLFAAYVGAGNHTNIKSAINAMQILAKTKSNWLSNCSPRLAYSAVVFVQIPMPTSMATFTKNPGSANKRSLNPPNCINQAMIGFELISKYRFNISAGIVPFWTACPISRGNDSSVLPAANTKAAPPCPPFPSSSPLSFSLGGGGLPPSATPRSSGWSAAAL